MARVIVILALMVLISGVIFALTRKPVGADADARATVSLNELPSEINRAIDATLASESGKQKAGAHVSTTQDVLSGLVAGAAPAFSSVGVDNRGRASFTGTASPGDDVSIVHDGRTLGTAAADNAGNWTIDFKVLPVREEYELLLSARRRAGQVVAGPQRALISPPDTKGGLPKITLKALEIKTTEAPTTDVTELEIGIVIEHADAASDGTAVLKGRSDPGATVRALIEGNAAGQTKVGADGKWKLGIKNGLGKPVSGVLLVLENSQGAEIDHAEIPLKLVAGQTEIAQQPSETHPAVPPSTNGAVRGHAGHYVKVRRGDSLWRIARRTYGSGRKWVRIYNANRHKIKDPDLLRPGRRIYVPD